MSKSAGNPGPLSLTVNNIEASVRSVAERQYRRERPFWKGILRGVCDKFVHNQRNRNGAIGIDMYPRIGSEFELAGECGAYWSANVSQICVRVRLFPDIFVS